MSVPQAQWIKLLRSANFPRGTVLVAEAITRYIRLKSSPGHEIHNVSPRPEFLMRTTRYSRPTIFRHLEILKDHGWLYQVARGQTGQVAQFALTEGIAYKPVQTGSHRVSTGSQNETPRSASFSTSVERKSSSVTREAGTPQRTSVDSTALQGPSNVIDLEKQRTMRAGTQKITGTEQ